jgi:aldose 1-epimerase
VVVEVDPAEGGRATSWTVGGRELLDHHGDDPVEHGMYAMAPWAGRLRDNVVAWGGRQHDLPATYGPWALHGTCVARPATVLEHVQEDDSARLVLRLDRHPHWPWRMAVDLTWELIGRELVTVIAVHALDEPFPAVVGWHPWFRRRLGVGGPMEWSLPATSRLVRGDDHLPTGQSVPFDPADGPFDDAFTVPDGRAHLRWPGVLGIDVVTDGGWFVVFDELAGSVCIEPQSGPPDGLHVGSSHAPAVATPGRPHVLTTRWVMLDEPPADRE